MKLNKYLSISTIVLTLTAFILSLCWHSDTNINTQYWTNIMFAIFGSGLLSAIASVTGYYSECQKYKIVNLAFTRNFLVQTGNSLMYIQSYNPNPESIYRELLNLCTVFDNFAFENYPLIKDYYCHCSNKRRELEVTQAKIKEIWHKLIQAKNLSQDAKIKNNDNFLVLVKEIDVSCKDLVSILQPKGKDSVVKTN